MISLKNFTGEFPRTAPHLLPDHASTNAVDCDFTANTLTGISEYSGQVTSGVNAIRSAFFYTNSDSGDLSSKLFAWSKDTDVVRGPIANDAYDRIYWTQGDSLFVTRNATINSGDAQPDAANTFKTGVPVPSLAPVAMGDAFILDGHALTSVFALSESSSKNTISETQVSSSLITNQKATASQLTFDIAWNVTDSIYVSGDALSSTLKLPDGFSSPTELSLFADKSIDSDEYKCISLTNGTVTTTNRFGSQKASSAQYVYLVDWQILNAPATLYASNPATKTVLNTTSEVVNGVTVDVVTQSSEVVEFAGGAVTYYGLGNGWYGVSQTMTAPTENIALKSFFALKVYFGTKAITIRESSTRSDVQSLGVYAKFNYDQGVVSVSISKIGAGITMRRYYSYTYVNVFGEEGPPSPVCEIDAYEQDVVSLTLKGVSATDYAPIDKIRLYRTATGTTDTAFLFVSEMDNASSIVFSDDILDSALGESLSTTLAFAPEDGLRGLQVLPNGILVAFKKNEIHFSEPYLPYSWNPENVMTCADAIVGLCTADSGFYVITRSAPYFVSGITPDAMSQIKLSAIQAGVSKGAICNIGSAVIYASHDGLVAARGIEASLDFSFKFFTRNDWRKRYGDKLDKMRLNAHDGHLVAWFEDGTPGFMVRFDEVEPTLTKLARGFYAATVNQKDDALHVSLDGTTLVAFKGSLTDRRPYQWSSKDFILPVPTNFGACQVVGSGDVRVHVFADGALVKDKTVAAQPDGKTIFRLPAGFRKRRWSVSLSGTGEVQEFNLAVSPSEFANV